MVTWTVILAFLFVFLVYLLIQKIYNENKIKKAQRDLVGKVILFYFKHKKHIENIFNLLTNNYSIMMNSSNNFFAYQKRLL